MRPLFLLPLLPIAALGWSAMRGDGDAGPAAAVVARDVTARGSLSSPAISLSGPPVTARLSLRTGSVAATVAVGVEPSRWPDADVAGSPLRLTDQTLTGAGRLTGGYAAGGGSRAAGSSQCRRGGPDYQGGGIDLALPANSTTTLSWKVTLAAPPWAFAPTRLGWIIAVPATAKDPAREITYRQVTPVRFHVMPPYGVRIHLRAGTGARPAPRGSSLFPYPQVKLGHPVRIEGSTRPEIARARVRLQAIDTRTHRRRTIGSTVTGTHGAFAVTWRPPHPGVRTITATLAPHQAGVLADHNCDLALSVRR